MNNKDILKILKDITQIQKRIMKLLLKLEEKENK